jgi:hypothetical protein
MPDNNELHEPWFLYLPMTLNQKNKMEKIRESGKTTIVIWYKTTEINSITLEGDFWKKHGIPAVHRKKKVGLRKPTLRRFFKL